MLLVHLAVLSLIALSAWLAWRSRLVAAGRQALSQQPETITFSRVPADQWRDPAMAEWLSVPLREKGFVDLGVYAVLPLPDFRIGVMINERDKMAAFLCEHPKALGISLELNVRYVDGTTTMLINRADRGVPRPPFFRVIHAEPDTLSAALYERLLRERASFGIKTITAENVIPEYQAAWTRMMLWEKGRGLTADEVAQIAQRRRSLQEDKANLRPQTVASQNRRAAQILVAVPGIIFLSLVLHGSFADYQHMRDAQRRAEARTAQAEGTIVEVHDRAHRVSRYPEGSGVFVAASGREVRFFNADPNVKVGMKVPVSYDPRHPDNYSLGHDLSGFTGLIFGNAPFFVMGLFFLFLAGMLGRRKA